ncbi:hypothetical protein PHMEG_00016320 [Phytophthora megakarya]|uniref:Uncharacterized protein n=1 Tax=Phytophthora megakarya TaxID=4795 RepID=A0A225W1P7_9STRA|nr:hypothetical protein PHMEG_00016320 [Phytophthora megakarya]
MAIAFKTAQHRVAQYMERYHVRDLNAYACEEGEQSVQRNLSKELIEVSGLREIGADVQHHLIRLLARWVAEHFRPLVIVEDNGFVEFISFITETLCGIRVGIPKRTQLRSCIISVADDLRLFVRADIERSCEYFFHHK